MFCKNCIYGCQCKINCNNNVLFLLEFDLQIVPKNKPKLFYLAGYL